MIVKNLLEQNQHLADLLSEIAGNTVAIHLTHLEKTIYCQILTDDLKISLTKPELEPVVTITGPIKAFITFMVSKDISFAQKTGLRIDGDLGVAEKLKKIMNEAQLDFAELIAPITGDIIAENTTILAKNIAENIKSSATNLGFMASDYLQHESKNIVSKVEIESFIDEVNKLRDKTELLDVRLNEILKKTS